jgi:hypothetical protein
LQNHGHEAKSKDQQYGFRQRHRLVGQHLVPPTAHNRLSGGRPWERFAVGPKNPPRRRG